jgi:hypothetical protein
MTYHEATSRPLTNLQALIEQHGVLAVGGAFLCAALARNTHPADLRVPGLSLHLRRDLGLPPFGDGRHIR